MTSDTRKQTNSMVQIGATDLFATAFGLLTNADRCIDAAKRRYADDQMFIGRCMRWERESRKVSLRALAKEMKLSAPYVADLELGHRNWSQIKMANYGHAIDSMTKR